VGTIDAFAYNTLRTQTGRQREAPNEVPPLAISLDADQMRYMQQLSSRRQGSVVETVAETVSNQKLQPSLATSGPAQIGGTATAKHQL